MNVVNVVLSFITRSLMYSIVVFPLSCSRSAERAPAKEATPTRAAQQEALLCRRNKISCVSATDTSEECKFHNENCKFIRSGILSTVDGGQGGKKSRDE
jgi:hypothetical protein